MENFIVRPATADDAEAINRIANWYIENTAVNFDTAAWPLHKRVEWIESFNGDASPYRLLAGENKGRIIGFSNNTRFRPKAAYESSTETTVYMEHGVESRGRGRILYEALLAHVATANFHRAYAVITLPNPASVRLHEDLGFSLVGTFDEIGRKFDRYHSVAMYQKIII